MSGDGKSVMAGPHSQTMAWRVRDLLRSKAKQPNGSAVVKLLRLRIWPLSVWPSAPRLRCSVGNRLIMSLLSEPNTRSLQEEERSEDSSLRALPLTERKWCWNWDCYLYVCRSVVEDQDSRNSLFQEVYYKSFTHYLFHFTMPGLVMWNSIQ